MKKIMILVLAMLVFSVASVAAEDWPVCIDKQAPQSPTNLVSSGNVQLTWNAAVDYPECSGIDYYKVYRDGTKVDQVANTIYTGDTLSQGTYSFEVIAVDKAGHESNPASISVTIGSTNSDGGSSGGSGGTSAGNSGGGGGGGFFPTSQDDDSDSSNDEEGSADVNVESNDNSPISRTYGDTVEDNTGNPVLETTAISSLTGAMIGTFEGAQGAFLGIALIGLLIAGAWFVSKKNKKKE